LFEKYEKYGKYARFDECKLKVNRFGYFGLFLSGFSLHFLAARHTILKLSEFSSAAPVEEQRNRKNLRCCSMNL